jgi:chromosome segregation ATPase
MTTTSKEIVGKNFTFVVAAVLLASTDLVRVALQLGTSSGTFRRVVDQGVSDEDQSSDNLFATPATPSRLTTGRPRSDSRAPDVGGRPSPVPDVRSEHDDYEMDPLVTPGSSLAIPQASPIQVEPHNTLVESLERKYFDLKLQHDKVVLEVSERDARILSLQTDINDLSKKATAAMADKNSEFTELETTFTNRAENFERCIAEQLATITGLEREREEVNKKLSSLQQALRAAEENVVGITQLEDTIRDLGLQKKSVEGQLEVEQFKNCDLFQEIRNQNVTNESLLEQLTDLSTKIRLLEDEQANRDTATQLLERSLSESRHDAQVLRETITNLETSSHSKQLELVQSNGKVEELETALDNLRRLEQEMKIAAEDRLSLLEAEKMEKERLIQTVANKEQDILNVTEDAAVVKSSMEKLKTELFLKEAAMQELHGELAMVREKLTIAEGSLVASSEEHQVERLSLTSRLSSIEGSLVSANLEAKNLRTQLESAEIAQASVRAQVVERGIDLKKIQNELESERNRGNSLETELVRAKKNTQGLEEMIQGIKASKDADEKTIESLKNVFATFRESQTHFLMVMEEKVGVRD